MEFFVYGDDARQTELKTLFKQKKSTNLANADCIIIPPRLTAEQEEEIATEISKGDVLFGCFLSEETKILLKEKECFFFNYFESEESQLANAIPTATAAIALAESLTNKKSQELKIAVLGYGRIGKQLESQLATCTIYKENFENFKEFDVVINTVPAEILSLKALKTVKGILIDLASTPCASTANIEKSKIKYERALGLPAKYMPKEAAAIIKEEIERIIVRVC